MQVIAVRQHLPKQQLIKEFVNRYLLFLVLLDYHRILLHKEWYQRIQNSKQGRRVAKIFFSLSENDALML